MRTIYIYHRRHCRQLNIGNCSLCSDLFIDTELLLTLLHSPICCIIRATISIDQLSASTDVLVHVNIRERLRDSWQRELARVLIRILIYKVKAASLSPWLLPPPFYASVS